MYTIGFTTRFYTLWNVERFQAWTTVNGAPVSYWRTAYTYMKNLSFDLEKAKSKVEAIADKYNVDLELRGHSSFFIDEPIEKKPKEVEKDYAFTFGKFKGVDIRTVCSEPFYVNLKSENPAAYEFAIKDGIWQLERAMKMESTGRRKVYARRRLIELGCLVRRTWMDKNVDGTEVRRNWMPAKLAKYYEEIGDKKAFYFTDGERRKIEVKELRTKLYDGQYGTVYAITYVTPAGEILTYKGTTPPRTSKEEFTAVQATVKHDDYKGQKQTMIQRVKVLEIVLK